MEHIIEEVASYLPTKRDGYFVCQKGFGANTYYSVDMIEVMITKLYIYNLSSIKTMDIEMIDHDYQFTKFDFIEHNLVSVLRSFLHHPKFLELTIDRIDTRNWKYLSIRFVNNSHPIDLKLIPSDHYQITPKN